MQEISEAHAVDKAFKLLILMDSTYPERECLGILKVNAI